MSDQPRWPAGTPVAPSGRGPGGGRFRGVGTPGVGGWAGVVDGRLTRGWSNDAAGRRALFDAITSDSSHHTYQEMDQGETALTRGVVLPDGRRMVTKQFGEERAEHIFDEETDDYEWGTPHWVAGADAEYEVAAEVGAARIAELIGARVPPVIPHPHDDTGVVMGFVDGVPGWDHDGAWLEGDPDVLDSVMRLGLLDMLIGNHDRHAGNWLVDDDGYPWGIDHGGAAAFHPGVTPPASPADLGVPLGDWRRLWYTRLRWGPNRQPDVQFATDVLHPDDIAEIRRRLRTLTIPRPGARGWEPPPLDDEALAYMEGVLDVLAPYAQAERRLIP